MQKLFRIHIYGLVQGVSYRFYAADKARALGLRGFIKNMEDGTVYAEAEGREDELKAFINWCRRGPQGARVEHVEMAVGKPKNYPDFRIEK